MYERLELSCGAAHDHLLFLVHSFNCTRRVKIGCRTRSAAAETGYLFQKPPAECHKECHTKVPAFTRALLDNGYTAQDIEKIYGRNLLRVMRGVENCAGAQNQPPIETTLQTVK
jgi:hypothetical protein